MHNLSYTLKWMANTYELLCVGLERLPVDADQLVAGSLVGSAGLTDRVGLRGAEVGIAHTIVCDKTCHFHSPQLGLPQWLALLNRPMFPEPFCYKYTLYLTKSQ